jgi:hypothetical protein
MLHVPSLGVEPWVLRDPWVSVLCIVLIAETPQLQLQCFRFLLSMQQQPGLKPTETSEDRKIDVFVEISLQLGLPRRQALQYVSSIKE